MSIGVGLGAFMDGFTRGYGIRRQIDRDKEDAAQRASDRNWQEEQRSFERERMQEIRTNRENLRNIDTAGRQAFDQRVEAGQAQPDQWDQFWKTYILPQRVNEYMRQGDIDSARKLQDWGESEAALKGGRLFASAMLKSQTGDHEGALADVISAGKVKGYIDHGYDLKSQEPIADADGNTVGYRLTLSQADGDEIEQDIAVEDIGRLIATYANPEAAWNSQIESQNAKKKQDAEVETHRRKKEVDQEFKADPAADYRKAREERMKNDLDFAALSPEEQDRIVRGDLEAANSYARTQGAGPQASPGISRPKTIVDRQSGREVPVSPAEAAPGLGPQPTPQPAPAARRPAAAPAPRPMSREDVIRDAADHLAQQGNPEQIALRLMNAGVPEADWPEQLKQAVAARNAQQGSYALDLRR